MCGNERARIHRGYGSTRGSYGPRGSTAIRIEEFHSLREDGFTAHHILQVLGVSATSLYQTFWRHRIPVPEELRALYRGEYNAREKARKATNS